MVVETIRKVVVLAVVTLLIACGTVGCSNENSIVGTVEDVTPTGIDSFSSLTIKDGEGRLWVFEGGRFPAFTPSHLIEHRIAEERVKVTFTVDSTGRRVIEEITDG